MDRLLKLLSEINKDKKQESVNEDNYIRHEALTELYRLYKNGTIQRANELLKE